MKIPTLLLLCAAGAWAGTEARPEIKWHETLPDAVRAAKSKKPIFLLRVLGDLDGKT